MVTIEWAFFCDMALIDRYHRLSIIGISPRIPTPTIPIAVRHSMLVAKMNAPEGERIDFGIRIAAPSGLVAVLTPDDQDVSVESAHGFLLVTMRNLPLPEEGTYRFELMVNGQIAATVPLSVLVTSPSESGGVH